MSASRGLEGRKVFDCIFLHDSSSRLSLVSSAVIRVFIAGLRFLCSLCPSGATAQNNVSSRSHAIFSIALKRQITAAIPPDTPCSGYKNSCSSEKAPAGVSSRVVFSLLHFVDLAGSERAKKSKTGGQHFAEGVAINSGLLALAKVIRALTQRQKKKGQQQQQQHHVPYRDSKLTRLLEPVLGGNSKALMIACVSPAEKDMNETIQTLDYAARARLIKNSPTINTTSTGDLIASLKDEIARLKRLLSAREAAGERPRLHQVAGKVAGVCSMIICSACVLPSLYPFSVCSSLILYWSLLICLPACW